MTVSYPYVYVADKIKSLISMEKVGINETFLRVLLYSEK